MNKFYHNKPISLPAKKAAQYIRLWWFRYYRVEFSFSDAVSYSLSVFAPEDIDVIPYSPHPKKSYVPLHLDVILLADDLAKQHHLRSIDILSMATIMTAAGLKHIKPEYRYNVLHRNGLSIKMTELSAEEKRFLLEDSHNYKKQL